MKWCGEAACSINNVCYKKGDKPKTNTCHVCDPELNSLGWAPAPACVVTLAGVAKNKGHQDGAGSVARFYEPGAVALGPDRSLYVADYRNNRIRRIKAGVVTTLAGAVIGPSGLAVDPAGKVYATEALSSRVMLLAGGKATPFAGSAKGYKEGPVASARFADPRTLALYQSKLYVADFGNDAIRLISGGQVSTYSGGVAGHVDGTRKDARYSGPVGVLADSSGIYVSEIGNSTVRHIVGSQVSTLAGCKLMGHLDGDATVAQFSSPWGLVHDGNGTVYVADSKNHRIRKIMAGQVTTLTGATATAHKDGPLSVALFDTPTGIVMDSKGYIYVADRQNHVIRVLNP